MVFNATFNNISVLLWRLVLLVEETGGLGENQRPVASLISEISGDTTITFQEFCQSRSY